MVINEDGKLSLEEKISLLLDGEELSLEDKSELDKLIKNDQELAQKIQEMKNDKALLDDFLGTNHLVVSKNFEKRIFDLVKEKIDLIDDGENELLITKYIDGEASPNEIVLAEKLIEQSQYYSELYQRHLNIKKKVLDLSIEQPPDNVVTFLKRKPFTQNFTERFIPLAAVFAFGVIISPFLMDQTFFNNNSPISLRGATESSDDNTNYQPSMSLNDNPISIQILESGNTLKIMEVLKSNTEFRLLLRPNLSGIGNLYIATSESDYPEPFDRGELYKLGKVHLDQVVNFPNDQAITVDTNDKQLRINVEFINQDTKSVFTQYFRIAKK